MRREEKEGVEGGGGGVGGEVGAVLRSYSPETWLLSTVYAAWVLTKLY